MGKNGGRSLASKLDARDLCSPGLLFSGMLGKQKIHPCLFRVSACWDHTSSQGQLALYCPRDQDDYVSRLASPHRCDSSQMRGGTEALTLMGEPMARVSFGSLAKFYLPTGLSTGNMPRYCTWNFCTSSVFGVGKSTTGKRRAVCFSVVLGDRENPVVHLASARPGGRPSQNILFPDIL